MPWVLFLFYELFYLGLVLSITRNLVLIDLYPTADLKGQLNYCLCFFILFCYLFKKRKSAIINALCLSFTLLFVYSSKAHFGCKVIIPLAVVAQLWGRRNRLLNCLQECYPLADG